MFLFVKVVLQYIIVVVCSTDCLIYELLWHLVKGQYACDQSKRKQAIDYEIESPFWQWSCLGCFNISHYDQRVTGIHKVLVPLYKNASSPKECHTLSAFLSMAVSKDMGTRGCFKGSRKATTSIKVQGGLRIPVGIPRYLRFNAMTENDNPVYPIIHPFFQSLDPCIRALSWCDTHSNALLCTWKIACAWSCIWHCVWLIIHSKDLSVHPLPPSQGNSKHITPPNHKLINNKLQLKQYKQYEFIHHRCRR